ncbi:MAG TPA: HAD family hydrolase [Gaiellaceae bacterium]|jgi:putative hydrolase of the HAD superfamily
MKAVVFDLWDTLVEWPVRDADVLKSRLARLVPIDADEFERRWREGYRASQTGPLADAYRALGVPEEHVEEHVAARHDFARTALRLRRGAREVVDRLRGRGVKLGLITVCSEEVPAAWPETELAGLFDAETFSSACGLIKPDPEIYLETVRALGVDPSDAIFVGDGANDELGGAARVGMTPVLFVPHGEPVWQGLENWSGLRITALEQVLELV